MPTGVSFEGGLSLAYRVCLWSRLANRVLLQLGTMQADTADSLYEAASGVDWGAHISPSGSLAVDFSGRSSGVRNEQFGAQRLKDAIVDQFRTKGLSRPTVDLKAPDVRVHARLHKARSVSPSISVETACIVADIVLMVGWRLSRKISRRQRCGLRVGRPNALRSRR